MSWQHHDIEYHLHHQCACLFKRYYIYIMNHFSLWLIFTSFCLSLRRFFCFSCRFHCFGCVFWYLFLLSARHICVLRHAMHIHSILFHVQTFQIHGDYRTHSISAKNLWILFFNIIFFSCLQNKSSTYRITIFSVVIWLDCELQFKHYWVIFHPNKNGEKNERYWKKSYLNISNIVHTSLSFVYVYVVEHLWVDFA